MGIFSYNLRSILEVKRKVNGQEEDLDNEEQEDDTKEPEQEDSNNEPKENEQNDESTDYNMGDIEDDSDNEDHEDENSQNNTEEPTDNNTSDEEESNDEDGESEANDYSMGDIDDEESEDDNTDSEEPDNSADDESIGDNTEGTENELKSLEDDIFKDIPPEQMNIKIMELKKQYLEVYATITDVLSRTNKIPKTTQNMSVLEFIINKLMELKDIVQFYLSNTFDTKTYVENMVNYQQYLATLNTINRLLKEISRKKESNT